MSAARTPEQRTTFYRTHKESFRGQLWERCRCGAEPVYMPHHLCIDCLMAREDRPRADATVVSDTIEPAGAR